MGLLEFVQDPQVTVALVSVTVTFLVIMVTTIKQKKIALQPEVYAPFRLQEKEELSHDTRMFRFALQSPKHVLGLPIGQHVSMKFVDADGKTVTRSYTPTSSDINLGHVDFVIKVYRPNVEPKFPDGGKMSMHLERLKIGDTVDMRGPKGNLTYMGTGNFRIKRREDRQVRKLGMMAGGTGITPMLQVISAVMRESGGYGNSSRIEMSLIFANKSEDDILLRDMIEKLAAGNPNFKFHYTLDSTPAEWTHSKGFITKEMVAEHMPAPAADTLILMCGPPPMLKFACVPALEALGFSDDMHFSF